MKYLDYTITKTPNSYEAHKKDETVLYAYSLYEIKRLIKERIAKKWNF